MCESSGNLGRAEKKIWLAEFRVNKVAPNLRERALIYPPAKKKWGRPERGLQDQAALLCYETGPLVPRDHAPTCPIFLCNLFLKKKQERALPSYRNRLAVLLGNNTRLPVPRGNALSCRLFLGKGKDWKKILAFSFIFFYDLFICCAFFSL